MKICAVCGGVDHVREHAEIILCVNCRRVPFIKKTIYIQIIKNPRTQEKEQVGYTKITKIVIMRDLKLLWQQKQKVKCVQ